MCYKENQLVNKSIFHTLKNGKVSPSKVCLFQCDHGFLFSRENLWKLVKFKDCQDSIRVAYKWRIILEEFLIPIFCKMIS